MTQSNIREPTEARRRDITLETCRSEGVACPAQLRPETNRKGRAGWVPDHTYPLTSVSRTARTANPSGNWRPSTTLARTQACSLESADKVRLSSAFQALAASSRAAGITTLNLFTSSSSFLAWTFRCHGQGGMEPLKRVSLRTPHSRRRGRSPCCEIEPSSLALASANMPFGEPMVSPKYGS